MKSFKVVKKRLLKDKEFKRAYDELTPEFSLIEQIIQHRLSKGMSQATLAKKIGTKQSAIARLESGSYNPTVSFLHKVAGALDTRLKISIGEKITHR